MVLDNMDSVASKGAHASIESLKALLNTLNDEDVLAQGIAFRIHQCEQLLEIASYFKKDTIGYTAVQLLADLTWLAIRDNELLYLLDPTYFTSLTKLLSFAQ